MTKTFWEERYASKEYVYGLTPNLFYKNIIDNLQVGKILFPADGEGRNSVYAAVKGWNVTSFDISENAKNKALQLANINNVKLNYIVKDFKDIEFKEKFDVVVLIYVHFPPVYRKLLHNKALKFLKKNGLLILEAFSKEQIHNNSGGPKNIEMLYSEFDLLDDFKKLNIIKISSEDIEINEGVFHSGKASVIRIIGKKR